MRSIWSVNPTKTDGLHARQSSLSISKQFFPYFYAMAIISPCPSAHNQTQAKNPGLRPGTDGQKNIGGLMAPKRIGIARLWRAGRLRPQAKTQRVKKARLRRFFLPYFHSPRHRPGEWKCIINQSGAGSRQPRSDLHDGSFHRASSLASSVQGIRCAAPPGLWPTPDLRPLRW